ncbi:MAG: ATP-binding protein [Acidobacteriota bacterium]
MMTFSQHLFRALLPGFLIALVASGALIQRIVERSLKSQFDQGLEARAESLMALTEQDADGIDLQVYPDGLASYFRPSQPDYFEIFDRSGKRLFHSQSLRSDQRLEFGPDASIDRVFDVTLPDGRAGRSLRRWFYPKVDGDEEDYEAIQADSLQDSALSSLPDGDSPVLVDGATVVPSKIQVAVAISRQSLDQNLLQLNVILLLTGILTISALVALQGMAIRRAVQPIQDLSAQLSSASAEDLPSELTLTRPIVELDLLTERFHQLILQLRRGFERERSFSADLAHEIRTPLAELRAAMEIAQRFPEDPKIRTAFADDSLASVQRMERLVVDLLALSRTELGLLPGVGTTDLTERVADLEDQQAAALRARGQDLVTVAPRTPVRVAGEHQWPRILDNLLDNAIEYSPFGATIVVTLRHEPSNGAYRISIANPAPDLEESDLPRLFDRLWRKDRSRSSDRHSGLGLSLVRQYAEAVGARVSVALSSDDVFEIAVAGEVEPSARQES